MTATLERPQTTGTDTAGDPQHWEMCCFPGEALCGAEPATFTTNPEAVTCGKCLNVGHVRYLFNLSCADIRVKGRQ